MKIGTSLGKCVRSLLAGEVDYDSVFCVIANTHAASEDELRAVIAEYHMTGTRHSEYDMSAFSLEDACTMVINLYRDGKLHQPRIHQKMGVWSSGHHLKETWYDIVPTISSSSPAVVDAWNTYVTLSEICRGEK